jgi:Flp pilus assembly protein TadD
MAHPTRFHLWALLLAPALLSGCVQPLQRQHDAPVDPTVCNAGLSPADNTRLAGIEQVLRDGKPYAALAQLDAMRLDVPGVQLARAEALRRIDRSAEASALYGQLLTGCLRGRAHHGLGLLLAQQGRLPDALRHLQSARASDPTDVRVRNDLGYALLLSNRLEEARFEFLTVLDLSPREPRAARNLVLLTLREGRPDKARELSSRLGLDTTAFERLGQQATLQPPWSALGDSAGVVASPVLTSVPTPAPTSTTPPSSASDVKGPAP